MYVIVHLFIGNTTMILHRPLVRKREAVSGIFFAWGVEPNIAQT